MPQPGLDAEDPSRGFLRGGGDLGALMRSTDWSKTALGSEETWPEALKTTIRIMLSSRYAMWMGWGPDLAFFYNDAYRPTLGVKHPQALGAPASEVWAEIWADIGPRIERVIATGEATWDEGLLLFLQRSGYPEETYHTFSYSPLPGEADGVGGMLCVVTEETERIIGARRLALLRDLAAALSTTRTAVEAGDAIAGCLAETTPDLPFTLIYLAEPDGQRLRLAVATGIEVGHAMAPPVLDLDGETPWPAAAVLAGGMRQRVDLSPSDGLPPARPWAASPREALVVPLSRQGQERPAGLMVAGLNPFRRLDESYEGFVGLAAGQIAAAFANASAYEEERRRAEALAELDRAKTAFFSNVSHEFRTPLTLMLGPLEDLMAAQDGRLGEREARIIETSHRNGLRLLKLVNTLLDFSRIEAGRVEAHFEPTDLAELTTDLASNFRSAMDRAGLEFVVAAEPLPAPVSVDRDMWEKIVLNLLSNAFKFTFTGRVTVSLRPTEDGRSVDLTVSDTGTGIPEADLPRVFARFHRVEGSRGRSFEGSGIGLALVQELVRLHGGTIHVESRVNVGTSFTVTLPMPAEVAAVAPGDGTGGFARATATRAAAYVEEALRWLPGEGDGAGAEALQGGSSSDATDLDAAAKTVGNGATVLLADDNADMRSYIRRLLEQFGYRVQAVADGAAALEAIRAGRPDLVLSDVMMPRLDGFGLVAALRQDRALADLPIVLLSARAGEEARVEGRGAGADDYLTKPFAARELIARVAAALQLAQMRREKDAALRESEQRFRTMADHAPGILWVTDADGQCTYLSRAWHEFTGQRPGSGLGLGWLDMVHPGDKAASAEVFSRALAARQPFRIEYRLRRADGSFGWAIDAAAPRFGDEDEFLGYVGSVFDISDRKVAETEREILVRSLSDLNDTLELRVRDRTAELERANLDLTREISERERVEEALRQAQKMETIGHLTGGVAHDFNNLLTIILGNLETLQRRLDAPDGDTSRLRRAAENATRGAERAAALTQRLLAFSRRQPLAPRPVDVSKLVAGMSELFRRTLGETIATETVLAGGLWRTFADPNQLESALLNLAVNARDAMPGGGKLTIETGNAHLDDAYAGLHTEVAPGQYVAICVTDTGSGMSREVIERAFEPFFTTKDVGHGTGLGLSQVYGFVKQSGGHVKIYSEVGQGTTVKIYLPRLLAEDAEPEPEAPRDPVPAASYAGTVLVVEDDPDVRAHSTDLMRDLGFRVLEAADGHAALEILARETDVTLLFTDVGLPGGLNGRQLADAARQRRPSLRVLFTTGYARNAIVHDGRLDAGVELITKPFTYAALADKVRAMLDDVVRRPLVLVVEDEALVRMVAVEALEDLGFRVAEAGTAMEALNLARHAVGRLDAAIVDIGLPDRRGDVVAAELRALFADLPIIMASGYDEGELRARFADDPLVAVLGKPYDTRKLASLLAEFGVVPPSADKA